MKNTQIKIAAIGNQNNNYFSLVRYLRDAGFDAELLLTNAEQDHFHPRYDTYNASQLKHTRLIPFGKVRGFSSLTSDNINSVLEDYDILIGTGLAPALAAKAARRLDIFCPYGYDIWKQTFYKLTAPQYIVDHNLSVFYQRRGIGYCRVIQASKMDDRYEMQLKKYGGNSKRWLDFMPMVYYPQYEAMLKGHSPCTHWQQEFIDIRRAHDIVIMFAARNNWSSATDVSTKGIDIFLRGYHKFVSDNPALSIIAVFMEYGKDVERAKQEARSLGLENRVVWLPSMFRKDLMFGLTLSDICCGQFSISWIQNGTLMEALVAGKPILTWRDIEQYSDVDDLYPIYNAKTPDEIAARLQEYVADPARGRKMGMEGQNWYKKNVVEKSMSRYARYFEERAAELGKIAR
jgi:glycosyltransferase involved in cell wall biosynthesis